MCDLLIRYPVNDQLWLLGTTDGGNMTTAPVHIPFPILDPTLIDNNGDAWSLTANNLGEIVATNIGSPLTTSVNSATLISTPSNVFFTLTIDSNGLLHTAFSALHPATVVPRPHDVTMSQWPDSIGVTCPRCGGATVTVSADMSCWCCACNAFVLPEDTTILVILDE